MSEKFISMRGHDPRRQPVCTLCTRTTGSGDDLGISSTIFVEAMHSALVFTCCFCAVRLGKPLPVGTWSTMSPELKA
jgi:hypothetical protein